MPRRSFVISSLASLAACSSGSDSAPAPRVPSIQITAENAVDVARIVLQSSLHLADVANTGFGVLTAAPPAAAPLTEALGLRLVETLPGAEGGEAVRAFEDRDSDTFVSTGDGFAITFVAFAEDGIELNGTILAEDLVVDGDVVDGLTWVLAARLELVNLGVTRGEVTDVLSGPLLCVREKRSTVTTLDAEVGAGFTIGGRTVQAGTALAHHEFAIDPSFVQLVEGAVEDPAVGGLVQFRTEAPFTGFQFLPDPSAGELEVSGAGGSVIKLRAVDFFNAEIDVDADGDGEVDEVLPVEWAIL